MKKKREIDIMEADSLTESGNRPAMNRLKPLADDYLIIEAANRSDDPTILVESVLERESKCSEDQGQELSLRQEDSEVYFRRTQTVRKGTGERAGESEKRS
jgi:hypothetical protein